jgi:hypothetical protein
VDIDFVRGDHSIDLSRTILIHLFQVLPLLCPCKHLVFSIDFSTRRSPSLCDQGLCHYCNTLTKLALPMTDHACYKTYLKFSGAAHFILAKEKFN